MNNEKQIKVYELKEVCKELNIGLQVLRIYIKQGKIKASKIGRKYVITEEAIKDFINSNTKEDAETNKLASFIEEKAKQETKDNITFSLKDYANYNGLETNEKTKEKLNNALETLQKRTIEEKTPTGTIQYHTIGSTFRKENKENPIDIEYIVYLDGYYKTLLERKLK